MESSLLDTERELLRRCVRRPAARVLRDGAVLVVTPNMALSQAPDDKQLVLGLVSTKTLWMETPEQLMARIEEAARFYPREQLGLSTQCGFASVAVGNPITEKVEEEKLRLVADVAHTAWS